MSKLTIAVTSHDHMQGDLNAPCRLVEYGDYECPSCAEVQPMIKDLQDKFGDRLSFVFRNFPLREIHPLAQPSAELAEYAASQGRFWEIHDLLFANQQNLYEATLAGLLDDLDVAGSAKQRATLLEAARKRIDSDFAGGIRSGVNGTPTFFVNGKRYDGPTDYESFAQAFEQVLISNGG